MKKNGHTIAAESRATYIKDQSESRAAAERYVFEQEPGRLGFPLEVVINATDTDAREQAVWLIIANLLKDIEYYRNQRDDAHTELDRATRQLQGHIDNANAVERRIAPLEREVHRLKQEASGRVFYKWSKIGLIKMLRLKFSLGLREAKHLLDMIQEPADGQTSCLQVTRDEWNARVPENNQSPLYVKSYEV